jgi:hypothetical protein
MFPGCANLAVVDWCSQVQHIIVVADVIVVDGGIIVIDVVKIIVFVVFDVFQ